MVRAYSEDYDYVYIQFYIFKTLFAVIRIDCKHELSFFYLFTFRTTGYDVKEIVNSKRAAD